MQSLEAELRSQADSHIIVRAVNEVDVIADFGSNSDRAGQCFETSARTDCELRAAICKAHGVRKACASILIGDAEILESNLPCNETRNGPGPVRNFGPRNPCSVRRCDVTASVETPSLKVCVSLRQKIVSHFGFKLN
jgi:hypothetical protein